LIYCQTKHIDHDIKKSWSMSFQFVHLMIIKIKLKSTSKFFIEGYLYQ